MVYREFIQRNFFSSTAKNISLVDNHDVVGQFLLIFKRHFYTCFKEIPLSQHATLYGACPTPSLTRTWQDRLRRGIFTAHNAMLHDFVVLLLPAVIHYNTHHTWCRPNYLNHQSPSLHMAAEVNGGSFNLGTPGTGDIPLPQALNFFWGK